MIIKYRELDKLKNQKTVYIAGSFDLFHCGHVDYLKSIKKKFPDYKLVVGLLPDKKIAVRKGAGRPIISQNHRIIVLDAIKYVDYVFICPVYKNGEDATFIILGKLRPKYVVFPDKKYKGVNSEFSKFGSRLFIIPKTHKKPSTTEIIERIRRGV